MVASRARTPNFATPDFQRPTRRDVLRVGWLGGLGLSLGNLLKAEAAAKVPLGRLGLPEEVAQAVLMTIGNAYMTGQTVAVNGGMHFG